MVTITQQNWFTKESKYKFLILPQRVRWEKLNTRYNDVLTILHHNE
jgi:hypothetical protein